MNTAIAHANAVFRNPEPITPARIAAAIEAYNAELIAELDRLRGARGLVRCQVCGLSQPGDHLKCDDCARDIIPILPILPSHLTSPIPPYSGEPHGHPGEED